MLARLGCYGDLCNARCRRFQDRVSYAKVEQRLRAALALSERSLHLFPHWARTRQGRWRARRWCAHARRASNGALQTRYASLTAARQIPSVASLVSVAENENDLVRLKTMSSTTRTFFVSGQSVPSSVGLRSSAYARAAARRLAHRARATARHLARGMVAAVDPWWLAVTGVSFVSLLLVCGWPDHAGRVADGLAMGVAALLYATCHAEAKLNLDQLRAVERRQALATQLACRALTYADLPLMMREATMSVARSLEVEYCAVLQSMPDDSTLVLRAGFGWPAGSEGRPVMAPIDSVSTGASGSPSPMPAPWQHGHGVRSGMSVGIEVSRHAYGVLDVYTTRPRAFSLEEAQFLQTVADVLGAAIERDRLDAAHQAHEIELTRRVFHDTLTGLPNRALFDDRLHHALARVKRDPAIIAVLFVDIDNFKVVNDTFGHAAGDDVLIQVADRLTQCVRESDTAARLGGDEFAIVLERATPSEATQVAARIHEALRSIAVPGHSAHISASIGIAISADNSTDIAALVRQADLAMYRAKALGLPRAGHDQCCAR